MYLYLEQVRLTTSMNRSGLSRGRREADGSSTAGWRTLTATYTKFQQKYYMEVKVVRVKITLACQECKQRNYNLTKDKKTHPDRMETKKYCKFCKAHTMHKETK